MLLLEHAMLQPPQAATLVVMLVSQPSDCLPPLQSAKPVSQAPVQAPAAHTGLAMWLAEQVVPQVPQLAVSVAICTSQPSVSLLELQSAQPEAQAPLQAPDVHAAATWLVEQAFGQAPQWR